MLGVAGIEEVCEARGITLVMYPRDPHSGETLRRELLHRRMLLPQRRDEQAVLPAARQRWLRPPAALETALVRRSPHPESRSTLSRGTEPGQKGGEAS